MQSFTIATNTKVLTTKFVMQDMQPVLHVRHSMCGEWQFHCGNDDFSAKNIMLVSLSNLLECDSSLNGIFDLPLNRSASREFVGDEWKYDDEPVDRRRPNFSVL